MANPSYAVYLNATPAAADGPRVVKVLAAIAGGKASVDLTDDANRGNLRFAQGVYLDLADLATNAVVTLTHRATGYRIRVKGGTQGWFPLAITDAMQFDVATMNVADGITLPLWFANILAPNFQWASV